MSKSKKKKRMMQKIDARINKRKPRKARACIEVEVRVPRHKEFGTSMGLAIAEARRNKHG